MSSNVNRVFITGTIKEFSFEDSYCTFILQQKTYYKTSEPDQNKTKISEYKVLIYKPNVLEMLRSMDRLDDLDILVNGYVASVERDRRGTTNYVAGLVFKDDRYSNVIVGQEIIFIHQKPSNMSEEQFKNQLFSVNMCVLLGNTGANPEVKEFNKERGGDIKIANISVATNMHYRYHDQKRESTTWHKVVVIASQNNLSGLVRVIENHVKRGDKLFVIGSLQSRKREDKQGDEKHSIQVILQNNTANLSIIASKRDDEKQQYNRAESSTNNTRSEPRDYSLEYDEEDNIPF